MDDEIVINCYEIAETKMLWNAAWSYYRISEAAGKKTKTKLYFLQKIQTYDDWADVFGGYLQLFDVR